MTESPPRPSWFPSCGRTDAVTSGVGPVTDTCGPTDEPPGDNRQQHVAEGERPIPPRQRLSPNDPAAANEPSVDVVGQRSEQDVQDRRGTDESEEAARPARRACWDVS